jgi:alcohol dehydrogenase (NADP+)
MKRHVNQFDLMIATVPKAFPMQRFMDLLKLDATLVNVGALDELQGLNGMALGFGHKSLAGSMIGGIAEFSDMHRP